MIPDEIPNSLNYLPINSLSFILIEKLKYIHISEFGVNPYYERKVSFFQTKPCTNTIQYGEQKKGQKAKPVWSASVVYYSFQFMYTMYNNCPIKSMKINVSFILT